MEDGIYSEAHRPRFHFSAKRGWLNDPNGLVYYAGEYHLFFQWSPTRRIPEDEGVDSRLYWGHAVSPDLVHWTELPPAIYPDEFGAAFSGSGVVDWDNTAGLQSGDERTIALFYTAAGGQSIESQGQPFTQRMVYSTDRGRTWTIYAGNPVLTNVIGENRDPKVFRHAPTGQWVMALYLDGNDYALFASDDLKTWRRVCDINMPGCSECPDMFELAVDGDPANTKWVFVGGNGRYFIGSFDGTTYTSESGPFVADFGANYYATQSFSDIPDGRRIQMAWMAGGKYPGMPFNQQMSFPCELTLRTLPEGVRLFRQPIRELGALHDSEHRFENIELGGGDPLPDIEGDLFDIRAEFSVEEAADLCLTIRGEELKYSAADRRLTLLGCSADIVPRGGRLKLQVLADRTSVEVFANDGEVVMSCCFLPDAANRTIGLRAEAGRARVESLSVFGLRSAWVA